MNKHRLPVYLPPALAADLAVRSESSGLSKNALVITALNQLLHSGTVLSALDQLGLALAREGHVWTAEERGAYERAVKNLAA